MARKRKKNRRRKRIGRDEEGGERRVMCRKRKAKTELLFFPDNSSKFIYTITILVHQYKIH